MAKLTYDGITHKQHAELNIDGEVIAHLDCSIDGKNIPHYSVWLANGVSQDAYQKYYKEIHQARIDFMNAQSEAEQSLISKEAK